jgi:hypothetical protein
VVVNMSDYTPGPWRVVDSDCVYGGGNKELAHMVGEANARLIAAAPDLLRALETLVPFAMGKIRELSGLPFYGLTETGTPDPPEVAAILNASDFEMARTAIAKAKGEG